MGESKRHQANVLKKQAVKGGTPTHTEINQIIALFNSGRHAELETQARLLVEQYPNFGFAWKALGASLQMQGKNALSAFQKAVELLPDDAEAHYNLGKILRDAGQIDGAVASYRRALVIEPGYTMAHNNLGNALRDLGQLDGAVASYRMALEINPNDAVAHNNLGITLKNLGQLDDAVASYRRALEIKSNYAEAYCNLGNALRELGHLPEAETSYRRAIEVKPDFAEAHSNLGKFLAKQGRLTEAETSFLRALELKPDFAEAHNGLGNTNLQLNRLPEAEASYRRALEIDPGYVEAHSNLGNTLHDLGQLDDAVASYRRATELQPHALEHAISAHLLLPIIPDTVDTITAWRERFQTGIAALMNTLGSLEDPANKLNSPSFYLAYHNHNDRPVMEDLCHFFRARVTGLTATAPHVPYWQPPLTSNRRIRVGVLSQFLWEHTIGKHYKGFIHHLDRSRFEVLVIHGHRAKHDAFRQELDELADKTLTLPEGLKGQQQAVAEEKLDVLFYPDIGMATSTYLLAYARLAPVQATSWGHPDTSGLDTIDYYVSSSANEPENAEAYYTERLIRLNRLPCFYYQPPVAPTQRLTKAELGLPETGILYGCPQSLFKIHPDFDAVLAAIAEGDPTGHIVLPEGKYPAWTDLLKARWEKNFPGLSNRVLFLPFMPWDRFMMVMAYMDVLLDPLHFGSGNTLYDAMVCGTPVVTWPGRFARGRNVAAAYRQMGLADAPIAPHPEDYAPLALALGRDPERRRALREASLEAAGRELFGDMQAVREFEAFLEAAVEAAGRGEKLPADWRPNIKAQQSQQETTAGTDADT